MISLKIICFVIFIAISQVIMFNSPMISIYIKLEIERVSKNLAAINVVKKQPNSMMKLVTWLYIR